MLKNYDQSVEINNPYCLYISEHSYRVIIIGGLGSGRTNTFLNLIKHQESQIFARQRSIRIKVSIAYQ